MRNGGKSEGCGEKSLGWVKGYTRHKIREGGTGGKRVPG